MLLVPSLVSPRPQSMVVTPYQSVEAAAAETSEGSTLHLAPGRHAGFEVSRRLTVIGAEGTVVDGGIRISGDGVRLQGIRVEGAENGITVRDAQDVVITDVTVQASLHGIEAVDSSVVVSGCRVFGLGGYGQGFEIRNSDTRPRSRVEGCVIEGGQEGLVAHVSRAEFVSNQVSGTTQAGIVITEMSEARVERNEIIRGTGTGLYCGDMSHCEFRGNIVRGIAPDPLGIKSRAGFGAVASYYATMRLTGNSFEVSSPEPVGLFTGSIVTGRFPLSHWPPGLPGLLPGIPVVLAAIGILLVARWAVGWWASRGSRALSTTPITGLAWLALTAGFTVQTFHMLEHLVQVVQVHALRAERRAGLVGHLVDTEWLHFSFNAAVLVFIAWALLVLRSSREGVKGTAWLAAAGVIQGYHVVEHVFKVVQHQTVGLSPAPGLLASTIPLVWFHFGINLAVYAGMAVAMAPVIAGSWRRFSTALVRRPAGQQV